MFTRSVNEAEPVILGYIGEEILPVDDIDPFCTKIGGKPVWPLERKYDSDDLSSLSSVPPTMKCSLCGRDLLLILQAFAPLPILTEYNRFLLLFGCNNSICSNRSEGWLVLRCQTPYIDSHEAQKKIRRENRPKKERIVPPPPPPTTTITRKTQRIYKRNDYRNSLQTVFSNPWRINGEEEPGVWEACHWVLEEKKEEKATITSAKSSSNDQLLTKEDNFSNHLYSLEQTHSVSSDYIGFCSTTINENDNNLGNFNEDTSGTVDKQSLTLDQIDFQCHYVDVEEEPPEENITDIDSGMQQIFFDDEHWATEEYEVTGDKLFLRFQKRLSRSCTQILRYQFGGIPLWYSSDIDHALLNSIPRCSSCGGKRVFELQLMPTLISLGAFRLSGVSPSKNKSNQKISSHQENKKAVNRSNGIEFGIVCIYSCARSCGGFDRKYHREWVFVQRSL